MIFHLLVRHDWDAATGDASVASPGEDGYVHCCDEGQIAEVVALAFDPTRLPAETRYEPGALGEPERFPHVYGDLPRDRVAFVRLV